jgi:hypothetical protein
MKHEISLPDDNVKNMQRTLYELSNIANSYSLKTLTENSKVMTFIRKQSIRSAVVSENQMMF